MTAAGCSEEALRLIAANWLPSFDTCVHVVPVGSAGGARAPPRPKSVQPPRHDVRAPGRDQPQPHRGDEKKSDQVKATRQCGKDATVHPESREADIATQAGHHRPQKDREQAAHRPDGIHAGRWGEPNDGGRNHDEDRERSHTRRSDPCRQPSVTCRGITRNRSSTHPASVTPGKECRQTQVPPPAVLHAARVGASQRRFGAPSSASAEGAVLSAAES